MTVTDSVRSALEVDKVESHLHPAGSFDVADHVVPTGREEIWRFTPLKRLRGILDGEASTAALTWETTLPAGVTEAGHVVLRFGTHSRATVVLNHTRHASMAQVVEVVVGDGAQASVISLQDWADDAIHLAQHDALIGRDAHLKHIVVTPVSYTHLTLPTICSV